MDINTIKQKFQSGNGIEVPEARITKEEFEFLLKEINQGRHEAYSEGYEDGKSYPPVADERVLVQFGDVGCAGPFPVVDGRIVLSSVTMNDLAYRMASNPVADVSIKQTLKLVDELRKSAFAKGVCPDSGACHHNCVSQCARQHDLGCVPLGVSGLDDDWKLDIERGVSAPVAGKRVAEDTEVQRVKSIGPAYPYTPNTAPPTPLASVQVSAEPLQEVAGVTLNGCLETLFRVGEYLGIDYAESRKQLGAPSGVYIKAIEDRISQALAASSAVCQGRSDSLFDGGMLTAANEAHKCAEAIKWRAKELLDKIL